MESYLHCVPWSNYVQRWRLCASGPSCHHAHSISFPTTVIFLHSMFLPQQVKTLFSYSDHFTIRWWFHKNKVVQKHMEAWNVFWNESLFPSFLPPPEKIPVGAQSISPSNIFHYWTASAVSTVWEILLSQICTVTPSQRSFLVRTFPCKALVMKQSLQYYNLQVIMCFQFWLFWSLRGKVQSCSLL